MRKHLIYDIPTRIFHGLFSVLFVTAFFIAKNVDDESPVFSYHMLAGLTLGGLVFLRIIWGFIGTRYARFSSFALCPKELVDYIKNIFTGGKRKWNGHNPASSWAALVMLASALLLAISGILMTSGYKETFEDIHGLIANIFLITVLFHITGVILHSLRHKDGIALTMLHGHKEQTDNISAGVLPRPLFAVVFVLLIAGFSGYLVKNFNSTTRELDLFGKKLVLGDIEKVNSKHKKMDQDDDD